MTAKRILFAGMYDSGKTTFIAALWDYINSDKQNKKLTLNSLANSEHQYLDMIRSEWLQCKKVTRTHLNKQENVRMDILEVSSDKNIFIDIPDISGELFDKHFQQRDWSEDYAKLITQTKGILIFINPNDSKNQTVFITDVNNIENEIGEILAPDDSKVADIVPSQKEDNEEGSIEFGAWNDEHTSNQVKLVETLQFVDSYKQLSEPLRVSIIISRWDMVEKNGNITPETWLESRMPLLSQYLICNKDIFESKFFGVSAQGCDYGTEAQPNLVDIERMLSIEPSERPLVKYGKDFINDITVPITWLTTD